MKGRAEAALLRLLTSEQGLESWSRLKPNGRRWALSAESAGSEPPASEPWDEGGRGVAGDLAKLLFALQPPNSSAELLA